MGRKEDSGHRRKRAPSEENSEDVAGRTKRHRLSTRQPEDNHDEEIHESLESPGVVKSHTSTQQNDPSPSPQTIRDHDRREGLDTVPLMSPVLDRSTPLRGNGNGGSGDQAVRRVNNGRKLREELSAYGSRVIAVEQKLDDVSQTLHDMKNVLESIAKREEKTCDGDLEKKGSNWVGTAGEGKPKEKYNQILANRLLHIDVVFSRDQLARSQFNALIHRLFKTDSPLEGTSNDQRSSEESRKAFSVSAANVVKVFGGFLFALSAKQKRVDYQDGHGPESCAFRLRTLKLCLYHAQRNSFGVFREEIDSSSDTAGKAPKDNRPRKPYWLRRRVNDEGFSLNPTIVGESIKRQETAMNDRGAFQDRKRVIRGGRPTKVQEGNYVMGEAYSRLLEHLSRGRRDCATEFQYQIGYLFVKWNQFQSTREMDESSIRMKWSARLGEAPSVESIPRMIPATSDEDSRNEVNEKNYNKFVTSRQELHLSVEHDVTVNTSGNDNPQRYRTGRALRHWKRNINILTILCVIVREMCYFPEGTTLADMLSNHTHSLEVLYAVSRVFRTMLSTRETRSIRDSDAVDIDMVEEHDSCKEYCPRESLPLEEVEELDSIFRLFNVRAQSLEEMVERAVMRVPESSYESERIERNEESYSDIEETADNIEARHDLSDVDM